MKYSISLNDELANTMDSICKEKNISRSAFISMAITEKIKADNVQAHKDEIIEMIGEFMVRTMKGDKINDDELQFRLKQFEQLPKIEG